MQLKNKFGDSGLNVKTGHGRVCQWPHCWVRTVMEDPVGSLAIYSSWNFKLWIQWDTLSQKIRGKATEQDTSIYLPTWPPHTHTPFTHQHITLKFCNLKSLVWWYVFAIPAVRKWKKKNPQGSWVLGRF